MFYPRLIKTLILALVLLASWEVGGQTLPLLGAGPGAAGSLGNLLFQCDYTAGSLCAGDSDTRASTANYVNSSAVVSSAAINTARFDYNPVTLAAKGWLLEVSRTNSVFWSQDFSNAAWTVGTGTTKTAAFGVGPDGTTTAARVQLPAAAQGGGTNFFQQQKAGAGLGANQTHTFSMWVKSNTGGNQVFALKVTQTGVADHFSSDFTATTTWQLFAFTQAFGAGGTGFFVGVLNGSGAAAADLQVWGGQLEQNSAFATSYIGTTSANVTRSADTGANANWWNNVTGNYLMVESTDESTGVTSRASYCNAGCTGTNFTAPASVWLTRICQFNATPGGATAAQTQAAQANGTPCS